MKLQKSSRRQNDQILKEVRPQLVQTPRNDEPASGSRLRECIQNFETMEKEIQFSRICENATFFHRVSFGMLLLLQDGFGDRTPASRGFSHPGADSNSRIYAHEVRNTAKLSGTEITGKQWMPDEEHGNTIRAPLYSGGKRMKSIEILGNPTVGQKIDISHIAPWHHRHRYESAITLVCKNDDDREAGSIRAR